MKGPLFLALENHEFRELDSIRLEDLETEYTILLESRTQIPEIEYDLFGEFLSLSVLCWFGFPGKTPAYRAAIRNYLLQFEGIASNPNLKSQFQSNISIEFKNARSFTDISLDKISNVFLNTPL